MSWHPKCVLTYWVWHIESSDAETRWLIRSPRRHVPFIFSSYQPYHAWRLNCIASLIIFFFTSFPEAERYFVEVLGCTRARKPTILCVENKRKSFKLDFWGTTRLFLPLSWCPTGTRMCPSRFLNANNKSRLRSENKYGSSALDDLFQDLCLPWNR